MTSRERIRAAIMHQTPDRVPSTMQCVDTAWEKLIKYFGVKTADEVQDILDIDTRIMDLPPYIGPEKPPFINADGEMEYTHPLGYRYINKWNGVEYNWHMVYFPYEKIETWEQFEAFDKWTNPDWFDYSAVKDFCDRHEGRAIRVGWPGPYQVFTMMYPAEKFYENMMEEPELIKAMLNKYCDISLEKRLLHSPNMAKEYGIGMVYQELSLAQRISIYENLLVGRLPKKNALFIDKKKAVAEARELLAQVGLAHLDPTMDMSEISQCDAQLVENAKVLGSKPKIIVMDEPTSALSSEEVLRVEDYTRWGFFHHVNFSLRKGEVLVICGLAGSGRTEIARSLVSIDQINRGKLFIHGKETHFKNFGEAIKGGIGYLSENRKLYGLALPQTVQDNVLSCVIDKYANGILYNPARHTALVQEKIDEMQVYPADPQRQVNSFSGGNQQKVLMAKWLAADVDILILDEPTRGVDVGAKQTIHDAIRRFVKQGKSVILLSSDLPEVVGLCDRAVILREGHIIGEIPREAITENSLLIAANGEGEYVK